ncbi:ABC transporter ATP-binding protein [Clostridium niameyense]|uniref:ABC transporter ATP-binding protein n=1 Tax=Clostridium niameyense TaxID=1622073 RepID=UPI00067F6517|nr:ATP-binding cassette domain-containing protein [Clostridium niameyense]
MEKVMELSHVTKVLSKRKVLDDISFYVPKGSIMGFLGPNGAGKTTTIRVFTGLISCSGEVRINNISIKEKRHAVENIGAIVENPIFFNYMSGEKNLKALAILDNIEKESINKRIEEVINIVGLKGREKDKVKNYSLGMKQRLGIAQALLNNPKLLILDEPTNGLDPIGIKELRDLILKLNKEKGITVFISSHLLDELQKICTDFIVINNGKIIKQGTKEEFLNYGLKDNLEETFINIMTGGK